jgi:hypothetical protein
MNIPSNRIVTGSYTSGKDFVYRYNNSKPYTGYFYKFNGSYYASRSYDENAKEIIPAPKATNIFSDPNSLVYGVLKGAQAGFQAGLSPSAGSQSIPTKSRTVALQSIIEADKKGLLPQSAANLGDNSNAEAAAFEASSNKLAEENSPIQKKRYFIRQINPIILGPDKKERIIIRECSEETYNTLLNNPNYRKASLTETKFPNSPEPQFVNQSEVEAAEIALPGLRKFLDIEFGF